LTNPVKTGYTRVVQQNDRLHLQAGENKTKGRDEDSRKGLKGKASRGGCKPGASRTF